MIKIRAMNLADIPQVYNLGIMEAGSKVSDLEKAFWSKDQLENWVKSDDVLLIAEVDGATAGFILTALHKPTSKVTWENQVVAQEFRGLGVGLALINEMKTQLKARGATYVFFGIRLDNQHFGFYEKIGFERGYDFTWYGMHL